MNFRNIWVKPSVSLETFDGDSVLLGENISLVKVYGLVCDSICVRRSTIAMSKVPGVMAVRYTGGDGRFIVEHLGSIPDQNVFEEAVLSKVLFMRLRIMLETIKLKSINVKRLLLNLGL